MLFDHNIELSQKKRISRIHFVGIGGDGMSGIAHVLHAYGYKVSGSNIEENEVTQVLSDIGIDVFIGHSSSLITNVDVVVISTAIPKDNVEVLKARELKLPIVPRAQMLGELMRYKYGIAVSGTHGKTTVTSLVTSIFLEESIDITFVIGARLNSTGYHAQYGKSPYLIAEADESDASFLLLNPMNIIINNIDEDHMQTYEGDLNKLKETFLKFIDRLPFYGVVFLCLDDPIAKSLLPNISKTCITYGFDPNADYVAEKLTYEGDKSCFTVKRKDQLSLDIQLNIPGKHNVLNALSALAVATEESVSDNAIQKALANYAGVNRRFEVKKLTYNNQPFVLIDDYGHHPSEIACVFNTIQSVYQESRILMVYQPHRYSRTRDLYNEFVDILSQVDNLILLDTYSAGESVIPGTESSNLAESIRRKGDINPIYMPNTNDIFSVIYDLLQPNDVLLFQGAGDIALIANNFLKLSDIQHAQ